MRRDDTLAVGRFPEVASPSVVGLPLSNIAPSRSELLLAHHRSIEARRCVCRRVLQSVSLRLPSADSILGRSLQLLLSASV